MVINPAQNSSDLIATIDGAQNECFKLLRPNELNRNDEAGE